MNSNDAFAREIIAQIFGDHTLIPSDMPQAPVLAQYVAAVTPGFAPLLAGHGVPTLGEELAHLLSTIELYLEAVAPGQVTPRKWHAAILEGTVYGYFEQLRHEADQAVNHIQLEREINFEWLNRPAKAIKILWHLADHTAHHRGRLAVMMRMCGIEPPGL